MFRIVLAAAMVLMLPMSALANELVGSVDTTLRMVGSNDRIEVTRYDDPKVQGASCFVSRAVAGGMMADVGLGEDRSRFSIACRATGPIEITGDISEQENVWSESVSTFFKEIRVTRIYDEEKSTILYLVWSTELIDGSPFNSISAIALN